MSSDRSASFIPLRGHRKNSLIKELALGNKSQRQLAKEFEMTTTGISLFKKRNKDLIAEVIAKADDEYAGLWIVSLTNRIAELQEMAEHLDNLIFNATKLDTAYTNAVLRKIQIFHEIAQLRGDLTQKLEATGKMNYVVEGVDMSKLMSG